ncbi:phosphatase PAP2 family protein [Flavobacterium sp.]
MYSNKIFLSFSLLVVSLSGIAQQMATIDTLAIVAPTSLTFKYKQLIIPAVLIGYGAAGLRSDFLVRQNLSIREEIMDDIDKKISVDDFIQYAPALSVYALNNLGIQGKNNLKDRSIVLGTSMALVFVSVTTIKKLTKVQRPDNSHNNSFPSGHTALAFAGAEFLYQEYKDVSVWYGVSGYIVASATGAFRIYNNKHWFTDVVAGAGLGILSTKAAYWLQPYMTKSVFGSSKNKNTTTFFAPYYDGQQVGGSFVLAF